MSNTLSEKLDISKLKTPTGSGIDQEESILVVYPDSKDPKHKEILFLKETSETIAIWEGANAIFKGKGVVLRRIVLLKIKFVLKSHAAHLCYIFPYRRLSSCKMK